MSCAPQDTAAALKLPGERSRSLKLTKFAQPDSKEGDRQEFFKSALATPASTTGLDGWQSWIDLLPLEAVLVGQLQSRMALHLSGSSMENAGILLDRYGVPYIPGSGVKGCARRTLIATLREWVVDGGGTMNPDSPLAPVCKGYTDLAEFLKDMLLLLGWVGDDLKKQSDFAYACGDAWKEINETALQKLSEVLKLRDEQDIAKLSYQGRVSFLEAHPLRDGYKTTGDLELDVLTSHHSKYYSGDKPVASDTESPIPVFFPVVAPWLTFIFPLISKDQRLLSLARTSLAIGLSVFGMGAKTAAGYGWFDTSEAVNAPYRAKREALVEKAQREAEALAARIGDYDEASYKTCLHDPVVLIPNNRGDFMNKHIPKLREPQNRPWLVRLINDAEASREKSMKNTRKKDWYIELKRLSEANNADT